jgi:hypothetical protein
MSTNKMAVQNIQEHHFLQPMEGEHCATHVLTELVRIALPEEFDVKIDTSLPPVTQIWVALSDFLRHLA